MGCAIMGNASLSFIEVPMMNMCSLGMLCVVFIRFVEGVSIAPISKKYYL